MMTPMFKTMIFCILLSVTSMLGTYTRPAIAQNCSDDFEQATISPAWIKTEYYGSISLSTAQHKSGIQAVQLSSISGGQREIHLTQNLAGPMKGTASVWFYDTAPGQQTLYARFVLYSSGNDIAAVYVQDYDGSFYYAYGGGLGGGPTLVARSLGWHHFAIDTVAGKILIDGIEVLSFPGDVSFDSVDLNVTGPGWRPDATYYFDYFMVAIPVHFPLLNGPTLLSKFKPYSSTFA